MSSSESSLTSTDLSGTGFHTGSAGESLSRFATVHRAFEAAAAANPGATALVFGERRLTYDELNLAANRLARYLVSLGVGPEVPVAVFMRRSTEMIVALLAAMKAGGGYVALDPEYPSERVAVTLTDSRAAVILTQSHLAGQLNHPSARLVILDPSLAGFETFEGENLNRGDDSGATAYTLFTSGSTGRPKGVTIEHRSVMAMLVWAHQLYDRREWAAVLASTSICFDLSVYEMFLPLTAGGCLVLVQDALALTKLAEPITLINTVPSAIAQLLRLGAIPASVRTVNLAGEPLRNDIVQALYGLGHIEKVYNLYGPSEDTTYSTAALVERGAQTEPSIGLPITGSQGFLFDSRMRPVKNGEPGELYLAGAGLARGYNHRPDLTAERFVPHPLACVAGERLYRTGDLVQYRNNGELGFLGRIDHQVKIRGFRIELGEIEVTLRRHPAIRDAAVMARDIGGREASGGSQLVAYLVPHAGAKPATAELRAFVNRRLPAYMTPSFFVTLEALPLTPNGKLDRKALPAPGFGDSDREFVAPRTETERALCEIWIDVLGGERIGIQDDFFNLGGHSLSATQVASRILNRFGLEMRLAELFRLPTIEQLAAEIGARLEDPQSAAARVPALVAVTAAPASPSVKGESAISAGPYPLSFAQERLWFLQQLDPAETAYHMPVAFRLGGELDVAVLKGSLEAVIGRQWALRSRFVHGFDQVGQLIDSDCRPAFAVINIEGFGEGEQIPLCNRFLVDYVARPLSLEHDRLFKTLLVRLAPHRHVLLLHMHHNISDGWSLEVLYREISAFYTAFKRGDQPRLPELPVQYADYATWQRGWLRGSALDAQMTFWEGQLRGAPGHLDLTPDHPRPRVQTFNGAIHHFEFDAEVCAGIHALRRERGVTLFMALAAPFAVLLGRHANQKDLCIGTPVANRNRSQIENLIGFFVNSLVLRFDLEGDPSFNELLDRTRQIALAAFEHQEVPFEKVVERLQPEREPSRTPLFQVYFTVEDFGGDGPEAEWRLPGLDVRAHDFGFCIAPFDITLILTQQQGRLVGNFQYNRDLFEAATIARLAAHFQVLVAHLLAHPELPMSRVPMLGETERRLVLETWNGARAPRLPNTAIHELFEEWVERSPHALAVDEGAIGLTYLELNTAANRLAAYLESRGVGPEITVGVSMYASGEMIIAMLAILKAGGVFVPLDPNYPESRLTYIVGDARVGLVLTHRDTSRLDFGNSERFAVDQQGELLNGFPSHNRGKILDSNQLTVVFYTSGTTGQPKGVTLTHRNMLSHIEATQSKPFSMDPGDGMIQIASTNFDAFFFEVWRPLSCGARLCTIDREVLLDPESLDQFLGQRGITHGFITTSLFNQLARTKPDILRHYKCVLFGGEKAEEDPVRAVLEARPPAGFYNIYGPTETTIYMTGFSVTGLASNMVTIPIGRPLPNVRVYLVDPFMQPVAVGVPGEIMIGGPGVARGYLHRPDITATRFRPDPFGPAGGRLYCTGDLARYLGDGNIHFLGRIDRQIKLRGFRIELGEIEHHLRASDQVRDAVVRLHQTPSGEKILAAYVIARADRVQGNLDTEALRRHLSERMPSFMMPGAFVVLDEFPLTPNGKLDERALPSPSGEELGGGRVAVEPRTATEAAVREIWSEVLGVAGLGVDESFFEMGGHSIMATRIVARVAQKLGREVPLRILFSQPTIAAMAAYLDQAVPFQATGPGLVPIPRNDQPLELSPAQERLWFLDRLEPNTIAYNLPVMLAIDGPLDEKAWLRASRAMVMRHEVLRTRFLTRSDGQAGMVVMPGGKLRPLLVDLSALAPASREVEALARLADAVHQPFDLAAGDIHRTALARLDENKHLMMFCIHHIVSDGWSQEIYYRDFWNFYAAFSTGRTPNLAPLPVQFADYAAWLRRNLEREGSAAQLAYWQTRLAGAPPNLDLPVDLNRPPMQTFSGARREFTLPVQLSKAIDSLCSSHGVTPFMVLVSAYAVLLSRYSGQNDLCIGTPVANRVRPELEPLLGFFLNTLVLRFELNDRQGLAHLLTFTRPMVLDAFANAEVPFEKVVEKVQPERDLSRSPLFQAAFSMAEFGANVLGTTHRFGELQVAPREFDYRISTFEMTLVIDRRGETFAGNLEFNTDLFTQPTIDGLIGHYLILLSGLVARPDRALAKTPMLSEGERGRLLREWNQTHRSYDALPIHVQVAAQVERSPDATALIHGSQHLSYRELDCRANRLAAHLRASGLEAGKPAAICLNRGPDLIVALLAVLKTGAAYVPLDPAYPAERIGSTLEDAKADLIVTESAVMARLPAASGRLVVVDDESQRIESYPSGPIEEGSNRRAPGDLAYVLFTSGSTGRPKGVAITHGSAAAMLAWGRREFTPSQLACTLAATSVCFDLSVYEIFLPLTCGGCLVLVRDALALADEKAPVTLINTVPSAMTELLRLGAVPASVGTVNLAGEPLRGELVRAIYALGQVRKVYNLYGPSEDTTYSTFALIEPQSRREPAIGRPLDNTRVYLLDRRFELAPAGCPGELCLAGDGLARGYLGRPDLTAERFVPNPFGEGSGTGGRIYRTGDLARYRPGGVLEYLGRIDHQVKLRGFRIELGEIEAMLKRHPLTALAVVMARDLGGSIGKQLIAYVERARLSDGRPVPSEGDPGEALRADLGRKLPAFMVPAFILVLETIPLTPNGKIDRNGLMRLDVAALTDTSGRISGAYVAPQTPEQELLAEIWCEVLDLKQAGIRDRFFDLGGHSLLATRVVSRIRDLFGVELSLREIFTKPTIEELAPAVVALKRADHAEMPPLEPVPRDRPVRLSFAQERLWLLEQLQSGSSVYHIPMALELEGVLDRSAVGRAFAAIVARHESLRTRIVHSGSDQVQVVLPASDIALSLAFTDFSHLPEDQRRGACLRSLGEEARRPFDLERDSLLRLNLYRLADQHHFLLVNMHHIISDGWSLTVLFREFAANYRAEIEGVALDPPPLTVQYADYAAWQRNWLRGETLERQLDYWHKALAGIPPLLDLPTDRPRPLVQTFAGKEYKFAISDAATHGLEALCGREKVTPFMALMGAFAVMLGRYAGQSDVCIGTPVANRNHSRTEPLIGFFVNTLTMRCDLSGNPSFSSLLARVREMALGAYANQDVPFEKVVERMQPERSTSHSPLFQVTFLFIDAEETRIELPGLKVVSREVELDAAKFDLILTVIRDKGRLTGALEYNTDLFDRGTIEGMGQRFNLILDGLVQRPAQSVLQVPMTDETERRRVFEALHSTWRFDKFELPTFIHQMLPFWAARTPNATALEFVVDPATRETNTKMTYLEMEKASEALADHLRALGVGPESIVAVCMDRTLGIVVALFAILKAGGVYMPLDPAYPEERLNLMLEDSQANLLLTQNGLAQSLSPAVDRLILDESGKLNGNIAGNKADIATVKSARKELGLLNSAFMIYTSGSTGIPKGAVLTHSGLMNFCIEQERHYCLKPESRQLQFTSTSFDASVADMISTVFTGATLVIGQRKHMTPGPDLGAMLRNQEITHVLMPPSLMAMLPDDAFPALRCLIAGGEVVPPDLVERFAKGRLLINGYGPTETTVVTIGTVLTKVEPRPPIGKPFANLEVLILDRLMQFQPLGVPGELFLGGVNLGRGYHRRPDLTAARFVPNPFSDQPGERVYKTGDLVRLRNDGLIEYLNRLDFQVKVRGFRIELGEIAAKLAAHSLVIEAVVLAPIDANGDRRLVAYVRVTDPSRPLNLAVEGTAAAELRAFAEQSLPRHMVPLFYVFLESFPVTANGKLDRRKLEALAPVHSRSQAAVTAPASRLERIVSGIWQEVLGTGEIDVHDNFFDLGGHSLSVARVHEKLQKAFDRKIPLVKLFEHPTVAAQAEYFKEDQREAPADEEDLRRASARKQALRNKRDKRGAREQDY